MVLIKSLFRSNPSLMIIIIIKVIIANNMSIVNAEKQLGEELAQEYLYPKLSKKEMNKVKQELNK